jgi:hypothetical protein
MRKNQLVLGLPVAALLVALSLPFPGKADPAACDNKCRNVGYYYMDDGSTISCWRLGPPMGGATGPNDGGSCEYCLNGALCKSDPGNDQPCDGDTAVQLTVYTWQGSGCQSACTNGAQRTLQEALPCGDPDFKCGNIWTGVTIPWSNCRVAK